MLKQIMCYLKTRHNNRQFTGFYNKPIDIAVMKTYKLYVCNDCGFKGKEPLNGK